MLLHCRPFIFLYMQKNPVEVLAPSETSNTQTKPRGLTRGEFLKMLGMGALSLQFAPLLAACDRDDDAPTKVAGEKEAEDLETSGAGKLRWKFWPNWQKRKK